MPSPPDPMQTAAAQSGMNRDTAVSSQLLNMVDQTNPWGKVDYQQTGTTGYTDSQGKWVTLPQFSQTTTLSPEQQAIFNSTQGAQTNLANIAKDQSGRVQEALSDPFAFDNQDAADWAYDLAQTRIAPQQQRNQRDLEARLVNSGIRRGTAAWDREMGRMSMANNDQNNQLALTGRSQAFAENLATRNQPVNELTALLSGSQISNPAQMSGPTPQTNVAGVDYTGLVADNYKTQAANSGGLLGGLFGLAGSLGGAAMGKWSDARMKTNITRVGSLDNGLPVYAYQYKSGGPMELGVMAQDVVHLHPEAVHTAPNGMMQVDYAWAVR